MKTISSKSIAALLSILALLMLQACAGGAASLDPANPVEPARVDALSRAILALGDDVEREEAQRAARVAISYSRQLADDYDIAGSPLFHNVMVNLGLRDRGLCVHWTRDLMVRLQQERLRSLELHWGVANFEKTFRIEHSTVIISARGEPLQQGLVLDAWRNAGDLYWVPAHDDPGYVWRPHAEVQALKERRAELHPQREIVR